MKLDLSALNYKDRIDISGKVSYDAKFLENSPIKKLDDVKYSGFITRNDIDEYFINIHIYGTMVLLDSVSIEKNQNALDINEFLWQNIVLEVPIRYTLCDAEKLKGDNWCVLSSNEGGE